MELAYPWIGIAGVIVVIVLAIIPFRRKISYKEGKKVANIELVEQTELYKKLKKRYTILNIYSVSCLIVAMAAALILASRPAKVSQINTELRNRDIFMCLDISTSVDQLNLELCGKLKDVVKGLDGERFGITIFNGQASLIVPLTTDYDYVLQMLDKLEDAIEQSIKYTDVEGEIDYENFDMTLYNFKYDGTFSDGRGSSLIGDGLASCLYNFPDLKENNERTRIIIFSTDNELYGEPYVTLPQAAELCKKNGVKVYGIAPEKVEEEAEYKSSMELTGGGYYKATSAGVVDDLIADIQKTNKSVMKKVDIVVNDKPQILFGVMAAFLSLYFVFSKLAKK